VARPSARLSLEHLEDRALPSASLLFDPVAGNLSILGDAVSSTVRESLSRTGFVDVAVDDQRHSGDPASAFFDPALAGATAATLTGIRFDGSFLSTGGTVKFNGSADQALDSGGQAFANLVHQAANGTVTLSLTGNDLAVNGSFTNSIGIFDANTQAVTVNALTTLAAGTRYLASSGNQSFADLFINSGTLTLGIGGTFAVTGDYTQASGATLEVVLGGTPASGQFSQMSVGGTATLNGTLKVTLANGYTPTTGDTFQIMTYGARSGDFTTGPAGFTRNYDDVNGILTLVAN
jgi:hypothetical protein